MVKSTEGRSALSGDVFASEFAAVVGEVGDAAGSASTTASMSVGDSFQGSLQTVGDTDWIEITLTDGEWYGVDLFGDGGSGVSDTYLRIYDSGGKDKIVVSGNDDTVINLRAASLDYAVGGAGFVSYTSGTIGGFTIANGVVIENATGSGGDDTITGNSSKNVLKGKGGADTISGRGGKDVVTGGGGQDTLDGGGDADVIKGNNGKDTLIGGGGNDVLDGGKGADTFEFDLDDGTDDVVKFSEKDVFDLSGLGLTYGTIGISITGTTAVVTFGTTVVSILDLQADLDSSDFLF